MLEMLTGGHGDSVFTAPPILGYNYDQARSTSVPNATVISGGTVEVIGAGAGIAGYKKSGRFLNTVGNITQVPALTTLGLQDFTFEGWFWHSAIVQNYQTVFLLRWATGDIYVGFGDYGFGYRLQASMAGRNGVIYNYSTSRTRNDMIGGWHHMAMVRKNGKVRFYLDGVQQMLASGTGYTYNIAEYDGNYNLTGNLQLLQVGGSTATPSDMYTPEFALYIGAKYWKDFTPQSPIIK